MTNVARCTFKILKKILRRFAICRFTIVDLPYEPVCHCRFAIHKPVRHMSARTTMYGSSYGESAYGELAHTANRHMANWLWRIGIWQIDYGELAYGKLTMANRHMAKRRIPTLNILVINDQRKVWRLIYKKSVMTYYAHFQIKNLKKLKCILIATIMFSMF